MLFLKLGGSLITDKTRDNTPRMDVIHRLAHEIATWLLHDPQPLLVGHGSGSSGHAAAKKYGTRDGVHTADDWRGLAEVSVVAARLNRIVADALHDAGAPVISVPPSASARCEDGRLAALDTQVIHTALDHGLVPLVMGDVALDTVRGGTIVSTEEVFAYLAGELPVSRVLLAGETEGVFRSLAQPQVIASITPHTWETVQEGIGASRGADVTGGMASKVQEMLALTAEVPGLTAQIFSGEVPGHVRAALLGEVVDGTIISGSTDGAD